jgi:hypothetical protein
MSRITMLSGAAVCALLALAASRPSDAADVPGWVESMTFGGDLRLRHDTQWRTERAVVSTDERHYSRNRERFRLRFGFKTQVTDRTTVGMRLASGSGFQNTTNQSFDGHARGKSVFIDRAYAMWTPRPWLTLVGGKHANPLVTSSLVWDPDVQLEGLSESITLGGEGTASLFAHLGQWVVEEVNSKDRGTDPALFAVQAGSTLERGSNELELAATYYAFVGLDVLAWDPGSLGNGQDFLGYNHGHGQQMIFDADRNLLNAFGCIEVAARLELGEALPAPVALFGHLVHNQRADITELVRDGVDPGDSDPGDLAAYGDDDRADGWMLGLDIGRKKRQGDLYARYFYQELEDYAFPAVFVDSDFHGGGTNNKGHCLHGRYLLADAVQARATVFLTRRQDEAKDGTKDENRLQLDLLITF